MIKLASEVQAFAAKCFAKLHIGMSTTNIITFSLHSHQPCLSNEAADQ